jgi:CBS-domain-containing membrane protein
MKVREIMTRDVVTARPDTPVYRIARWMRDRDVSGIPVVDDRNRIVGIVTDLDLIVRNVRFEPPAFFQILDGQIPLETPAHFRKRLRHMLGTEAIDVMTEKVVTIGLEAELEELAALMVERRVDPIPVVEDGVLVGIVSRHDIIRMMAADVEEGGG